MNCSRVSKARKSIRAMQAKHHVRFHTATNSPKAKGRQISVVIARVFELMSDHAATFSFER